MCLKGFVYYFRHPRREKQIISSAWGFFFVWQPLGNAGEFVIFSAVAYNI